MTLPRRATVISSLLFGASAVILAGVIYFALNIQVLKDWTLTAPPGDKALGDTFVVASRYTKIRQVTGKSVRTLECAYTPGVYISYPLDKRAANRAPGKAGTGVVVTIPSYLKGTQKLPAQCHVCVALTYPVLPFRNVPYFKCTNPDFRLVSSLPVHSVGVTAPTIQTSPTPTVSESAPRSDSQVQASSSNTTPSATSPQPNNVQPAPSILKRITDLLGL